MAAQESELRVIGAEMHNDLGQMLTALKLILSTYDPDHDRGQVEATLDEARQLTSRLLERVRDMTLRLRPPMLDDLGLKDTLDWFLEHTARQGGLSLDLAMRGLDNRPGPELETACFRVIQEAVTNVVRHAQARNLKVRIEYGSGKLSFDIVDDGRGFEVEAENGREPESGLEGMKARVMLMGGELSVASTPGQGTRVTGMMPADGGQPPEGGQ